MPGGTDRLVSTDSPLRGSWNAGGLCWWVVFGTLLGPEATGPGGFFPGFVCFWFPGCTDHTVAALLARVCGVCGTGLLFENYIVDASIF